MYKYKLVKKINPQDKAAVCNSYQRSSTDCKSHDTCSYGKHNNRSHRNGSRS
jgi:ribosome modulation factor